MLTVHHLNNSRSQRILWLLEELGLDYQIKYYERDPKTMLAPASLRAIHPLGKSPVLVDGNNVLAESGAIIQYILDTYANGRLIPAPKTPERIKFNYWMHYAEGSAMTPLILKLIFSRIPKSPAPFFIKPLLKKISSQALKSFVRPQLRLHFEYIENELAKELWFAGSEFSAADIQMSFPMEASSARGDLSTDRPHTKDFLKRIHGRPAYQRALEKGGTYELLS